jgi:hypothetical protein
LQLANFLAKHMVRKCKQFERWKTGFHCISLLELLHYAGSAADRR